MSWYREKEWALITANLKEAGAMMMNDEEIDCRECSAAIGYDDYINGDEPHCCPFCSAELLPYR